MLSVLLFCQVLCGCHPATPGSSCPTFISHMYLVLLAHNVQILIPSTSIKSHHLCLHSYRSELAYVANKAFIEKVTVGTLVRHRVLVCTTNLAISICPCFLEHNQTNLKSVIKKPFGMAYRSPTAAVELNQVKSWTLPSEFSDSRRGVTSKYTLL